MTTSALQTCSEFLRDFSQLLRKYARIVLAMPWPQLLMVCFGLSLLIALLPTALFLFFVVLVVKFVRAIFAPRPPRQLPYGDTR